MNLVRNLSYYTATAMINNAVPFFLLPVFTHYLSPTDYGLLSAITAYVAFITPFIIFGMPALFSVDFYKLGRTELRRKSGVLLGLPLTFGFFLVAGAWVLRDSLSSLLAIPAVWVPALPLLALLVFIPQWTSVMFQLADKPRYFAAYEIFQAMIQTTTALILIVPFDMHWEGRLWAMLLCGILANIVGILALRPYIVIHWPYRKDVREALKFGAGLLPHSVLSQLIRLTDRLFVVHFVGLSAGGEFAVGLQIASIMLVLLTTFNQAWTPYLFKMLEHADEQRKRELVKLSYKIALLFVVLFLLINFVSPIIFEHLISKNFQDAQRYVGYISLGYLFMGFYMLFTDYIFYTKNTHLFSIITSGNAVINLLLNYIFVRYFGAIGVTYAFVISCALVTVATWRLSHKVYPMPWLIWRNAHRSVG